VLIADDAFQHRTLARNIDIVLWDSYSDPAKEAVVPAGRLRESWRGLRRADILLITRSAEISDPIRSFFQKKQPDLFIDVLPLSIEKIIHYNSGEEIAPEMICNKKVLGFCGLGNPIQFFNTIGYLNPASITENIFRDHNKYSEGDVDSLVRESIEKGCDYLITTEKDAMNFPASAKTITNLLILQISSDLSKKIKAAIIQKLPPVSDKSID
jgi:tetraacyldisaccharide 4'-kinase